MTHPPDLVECALGLWRDGLTQTEIAGRLGVPRSTVRDWTAGRVPRLHGLGAASCPTCGGPQHDFRALPPEYVHLLGLYLGDGCLSLHPRGVYKLRIALDVKYPAIVSEATHSVQSTLPSSTVSRRLSRSNYVEVYAYAKAWLSLFPQHGPGKKHERRIALTSWQLVAIRPRPDLFLRGLLQSDGCRFQNTGRGGWSNPRYSFSNVSDDIKRIFCDACELLGLRWTSAPRRPSRRLAESRRLGQRMERPGRRAVQALRAAAKALRGGNSRPAD
jgi:hypothetical protein